MLEPQRQKCEHTSKACCDLPCSDACPFRSPHRWSHAGAHHTCVVVNGLAAASFAVKQAVVFAESDSARLTVCTGALCHRHPAFCDTPLPNDRSLATGMQCSPAVRSRGLQVRAVAELWAAVASHPALVTEQVCHPHHSHPAAAPNPKNSMRACSFVSQLFQRTKHLTREFKLAMPVSWERQICLCARLSSTFSHVADLPKASTRPCSIH